MKAIFKGNKFVIQWAITDGVTSLPFDFTGMFVDFILYSDNYHGRISGCTLTGNKMQAEIPGNILPVGIYHIACEYRNKKDRHGHCACRRAFQITRNPEFCTGDDTVVIESFAAPLQLENMSINYIGFFPSGESLPDQQRPAWALVGDLREAHPWFFYTADSVPPGFQTGWNDLSDVLGTYNLTADKTLEKLISSVDEAIANADNAADNANDAADNANESASSADEATKDAQEATDKANKAADNADAAAANANAAAADANEAADNANKATDNANEAADNANTAAASVNAAAESAVKAAKQADAATEESQEATADAKTAADNANKAADNANKAADECREVIDEAQQTDSLNLVPVSMELEYPKEITYGNLAELSIKASLNPASVKPNVLFLGDNHSVSVTPDGRLTALQVGTSTVHVIPTANTAIYKSIQIRVVNPTLRMVNTRTQLLLTGNGELILN